ncbi:MAG TPA: hypothetical protein VI138_05270 [Candidatus Dormibacteraeota bacterium]
MRETGAECDFPGRYQGDDDCLVEIRARVGDTLPPCPGCGQRVSWMMMELISESEPEREEA